ncbi:uncharacterized protein LOC144442692 [Glandiceps talaboti]
MYVLLGLVLVSIPCVLGSLPPGCTALNGVPISTEDVSLIFGTDSQLSEYGHRWTGNLRSVGAIPTQHFITNEIKTEEQAPLRLMPYQAVMSKDGVVYDAYTLDRWNVTERSDAMMQQTPHKVDEPWAKVTSLGTNMKQMVSGPDGHPKGVFTGNSGIRVGIDNSGDPEMTDFGDMYANFLWQNTEGSMEIPFVRGSPLLTHLFTNTNPVLQPLCLSAINGQPTSYDCPEEMSGGDGGEGYILGTCSSSLLTITLKATKPVKLEQVQWAAKPASLWFSEGPAPMVTCDTQTCSISENGLEVIITVPGDGEMAYAVNVIGRYIIPTDWTNNPETTTCVSTLKIAKMASSQGVSHSVNCGDELTLEITVYMDTAVSDIYKVQFAVNSASEWDSYHPMITCKESTCKLSTDKKTLIFTQQVKDKHIKYAYNIIGSTVQPTDWEKNPFQHTCIDDDDDDDDDDQPQSTQSPSNPITMRINPTDPSVPCTEDYCVYDSCDTDGLLQIFLGLADPIGSISEVQFAVNDGNLWDLGPEYRPMKTCDASRCTLSADGKSLYYVDVVSYSYVKYAINIIGRTTLPPGVDWHTDPYETHCDGSTASPPDPPGGGIIDTRFVFELDEPDDEMSGQTRKFVAYFSEEMELQMYPDGARFVPTAGGTFTGILQLTYVGSTARGDMSSTTFMDGYSGVYSYNPKTLYCVDDSNNGYISFEWNKRGNNFNGLNPNQDLLMTVMPHQEPLLEISQSLISTPYGYKGYVGDDWLMVEEDLPKATLNPDMDAVNAIKQNATRYQDLLDGLDKDTAQQGLSWICTLSNSYGVGKEIAMVARLASISRAFGTNHYQTVDPIIRDCLDMWLQLKPGLKESETFYYDNIWGGMFLSSTPEGQPLDPHASFGFPLYSDHHFHLGYFLYAMAYYAENYQDWAFDPDVHPRILAIARDVGNPSREDPYFPVVRHKDWYLGMSWATGVIGGLRQAESSTEAINCYHGLAALGEALKDDTMKHIGQLTLATEIRSVREYWHVRSHNRELFPPLIQDYGTIGQFAEDAIFYYTLNWPCDPAEFPMRHACLVGIQVIPITSISYLYQDQEWAGSVKDVCDYSVDPWSAPGSDLIDQSILKPVNEGWGAFCLSVVSQLNDYEEERAANYVRDLETWQLVGGSGIASTMLFIYEST